MKYYFSLCSLTMLTYRSDQGNYLKIFRFLRRSDCIDCNHTFYGLNMKFPGGSR